MAVKKSKKRTDVLKGIQSSKLGIWKVYHLSIEGIQKGYRAFSAKNGIWKGKGMDLGAELPRTKLC